jgi:hypothetical protein
MSLNIHIDKSESSFSIHMYVHMYMNGEGGQSNIGKMREGPLLSLVSARECE